MGEIFFGGGRCFKEDCGTDDIIEWPNTRYTHFNFAIKKEEMFQDFLRNEAFLFNFLLSF